MDGDNQQYYPTTEWFHVIQQALISEINCGVDIRCPSCLQCTHIFKGGIIVPSHQRGAAQASLSHGSTGSMGCHRSCNPRGVPQQGLAHDHRDESIPRLHPSSLFQSSPTVIISRRQHRKPWPNRKWPLQCEAASQLLQLCRRLPTLLSSLTATSCWGEAPFWGMHRCR